VDTPLLRVTPPVNPQRGVLRSRTAALRPMPPPSRIGLVQHALGHTLAQHPWLPIVAIVAAHVVFGLEEFPLIARAFFAVPAVLFIEETRAYLTSPERELPFVPLAMLQFYVTFGMPVFFEGPFYDLRGPVFFSDAVRIEGGMIVALGGVSLWGGARIAKRFSRGLQVRVLSMLPPEQVGNGWDQAFYVFTALTLLAMGAIHFAANLIPGAIGMIINLTFTLEFCIGLATVRPPKPLGRRAGTGLALIGILNGMLAGAIEPMARPIMSYVSAQWVATRRLAAGFITALVILFIVLQPIKGGYRAAVGEITSRTGEEITLAGRLAAWEDSFSNIHSDSSQSKDKPSALSRLSELSPVLNALVVIPSHVDYAYGATLGQILYAPIPRLIWPDKPDSKQEIGQRYAVIFGLQTEAGAQGTAYGMCLLFEAYWNFGWAGIPLFCGALGAYLGVQQRLFSGDHWALRAAGVAQLSFVGIAIPLVLVFGSLFQLVVSRFLAVWLMYWLVQSMSSKPQRVALGSTRRATRR
jgi:hypothetical protein